MKPKSTIMAEEVRKEIIIKNPGDRKVLIDTMTYGSATTGVRIYQTATGDTIDYSNEDSVDFSQPVEILIYTGEAIARKYDAWVNIHTQEPDSLVWKLYSDELLSQPTLYRVDGCPRPMDGTGVERSADKWLALGANDYL